MWVSVYLTPQWMTYMWVWLGKIFVQLFAQSPYGISVGMGVRPFFFNFLFAQSEYIDFMSLHIFVYLKS